MKRLWWLLVFLPLMWFFRSRETEKPVATPTVEHTSPVPTGLIGERILRNYGKSTPENDLTDVAHLMENFTLLVKTSRPLADNEDWAAAFRGQNPAQERFLPDQHAALKAGKLVDRWGTPLFIHALGGSRYEIRSAGPDQQLWTADDIHRNADGSFRHGADLIPATLY
ncbi:MAG: hypothetical protein WCS70_13245 [Verrucomicrobiota bacterium]